MNERLAKLVALWSADPGDADVAYMIALEHGKLGAVDEAVAWLDRALALDASYHYAYFQKGKLLGGAGRMDEARVAIDAGLARARADGNGKAAGELEVLRGEF